MAERDFGKAVELAGFFLAHAVWSIHEGGPLVPLVAFESDQGRNMVRFAAEDSRQGVVAAQKFLTANEANATHAVMVCDAFVTYGDVRKDTLIASVVAYGEPEQSLTIGIPYTPASDTGAFAVHRPKFLEHVGLAEDDLDGLGDALFRGVDAHEQAAPIWNAALDQSF